MSKRPFYLRVGVVVVFAALSLSPSLLPAADEISLFDSHGEPKAYIAEDLTIYLWEGDPIAYLVSSPQKIDIYNFDGKHLGWFEKGIIRDHAGDGVGFVKGSVEMITSIEPIKSIKAIKPIKGIREIAPIKPVFSRNWSEIPLVIFLKTGVNSNAPSALFGTPGGRRCESGHWIQSVSDGGKILKLEDGSLWAVNAVDAITSSLWLPVSNVVICGTKITNVDDKETVEANRVLSPDVGTGRGTSTAARTYVIQASSNDETFVINGEVFKARTYCFDMEKGDRVTFVSGSAAGACSSAEILNLRTGNVCLVWCE